jgi:hypothetical protein
MGLVTAQEDLYGPAAPVDVAFVRVMHAAEGYSAFQAASGEMLFEVVEFLDVTPYYPFQAGRLNISLADVVSNLTVEAGGFYTVALLQGVSQLFNDAPLIDSSRALLTFYNLTELLTDLKTADASTVIFSEVAPLASASIVVSEAEVAVAAFETAQDEPLAALEPQLFSRGVAHSVILLNTEDGFVLSYAAAELGGVAP